MELLRQTWSNLVANKLRSFLTMFGIMWGVISIVLLSAMGEGFQRGNQHVLEEQQAAVHRRQVGRTDQRGQHRVALAQGFDQRRAVPVAPHLETRSARTAAAMLSRRATSAP